VDKVMNLRVPEKKGGGISSQAEQILASQGELCSRELVMGSSNNLNKYLITCNAIRCYINTM
jgi:hypothetical protein